MDTRGAGQHPERQTEGLHEYAIAAEMSLSAAAQEDPYAIELYLNDVVGSINEFDQSISVQQDMLLPPHTYGNNIRSTALLTVGNIIRHNGIAPGHYYDRYSASDKPSFDPSTRSQQQFALGLAGIKYWIGLDALERCEGDPSAVDRDELNAAILAATDNNTGQLKDVFLFTSQSEIDILARYYQLARSAVLNTHSYA